MPMEGTAMRFFEHESQTRAPQDRQLCLSLASCASLSDVLSQVKLLEQQELCKVNEDDMRAWMRECIYVDRLSSFKK